MEVSLALAFAAGLLSFVSPCVLALVPVYLAFLGETATAADAGTATLTWRGPVFSQALLFIAGFSLLFILLGTSVGLFGSFLFRIDGARQVAGVLVIAIGLVTTGIFGPVLDRFMRIGVRTDILPAARSARALALGALVGIGWTPCIGPVLGAILTMGVDEPGRRGRRAPAGRLLGRPGGPVPGGRGRPAPPAPGAQPAAQPRPLGAGRLRASSSWPWAC